MRTALKHVAWAGARAAARLPRSSLPRAMILGYHHISDEPGPMTVSVRHFAAQMRWLAAVRTLVTLDIADLGAWLATAGPGERAVAVTFDDGYLSAYTDAAPILADAGIPSTVYVPSDHVGRPGRITGDHARELAPLGMRIGSHTRSHADLRRCPDVELDDELAGSRAALEDITGSAVGGFAYPYGLFDDRVAARVATAGYTHAVTTHRAWAFSSTASHRLPRNFVDDYDEATFAAVVGGGLHYLAAIDRPIPPQP